MVSEITGSADGGNISVRAASGGQIVALGQVYADASGGSLSSGLPSALQSSSGQGGDIVFADDGGTITAGSYFVVADGITASATGTGGVADGRSEEHKSELQSLIPISYAVFCLTNKQQPTKCT